MAIPQRLFSRPYRVPTAAFRVRTEDGVPLSGTRLGEGGPALVLCHGFLGWHRKRRIAVFAEELARAFTVYAFDLRGHGDSGGVCTYGHHEIFDVDAVAALARREGAERVVTVGISMGGTAVIRHGALLGDVDAVVSISAPATWDGSDTPGTRRIHQITATRTGRAVARALGYRLTDTWDPPETAEEVVGKIAPTPLIVVHGVDDRLFLVDVARRLYERAGEPKRLMLSSRFGHAEDGLTPAFAERLAARILQALA